MIAGANQLGHWITLNGQTIGGTFTDVAHGSTTAGPMWYGAMSQIQNWLPDATFTPPNGQDVNGVLTTVPDVAGVPYDQAAQQLQAAPASRSPTVATATPATPPTRSPTPAPAPGSQTASGTTDHDLPLQRHAVRPADPPRERQPDGNGNGNGNGTATGNGNGGPGPG